MFNRESIYIGRDMKRFAEIRDILNANGIDYKYKVKNHAGEWAGQGTVRGRTGSAGQPGDLQYEYEIFVRKNEKERAEYLIHSANS